MYNRNDTVKNYIKLFCGLYGFKFSNIHTNEVYKFFEIKKYIDSKFVKLSGGQKKIVEIFCALFHNPKILIFDELLKELDMNKQKQYLEFIKRYCNKNKITILFSAHSYLELESLANKIILIENQSAKIVNLSNSANQRTKMIKQVIRKAFISKMNN
jgi:ABC-2 type transport system ATP-binding protein